MIEIETRVKIPFLWGKAVFKKSNWSEINLIVGPNGSGKTLLAENLASQFEEAGYSVRFIKAEREQSSSRQSRQFEILRNDEKIRKRIETVLSGMFGKTITFIEEIDGTMLPIVKNKAWNVEYMLEEVECHGLKEIISLLISLYEKLPSKSDEKKSKGECIFFDEPELHLHPQFQTFFMNEIRKESEHNPKKIFFLISHSPFFIDLRTSEELAGVIACHINQVPTSIEELSQEDDMLFKKFLPRFNTYHKQFFFSDNQIFVEGYTDQQIFTNLLAFTKNDYSAAGTGIIDVGGKDELGVFCKVFSLLGTEGRIITDLDSLFSGKLRDVACKDARVNSWLNKQREKQDYFYSKIFSKKEMEQEITLDKLIYRLEKLLSDFGKQIRSESFRKKINVPGNNPSAERIRFFISKLDALQEKHDNADAVDTYKTVLLQGIDLIGDDIISILESENPCVMQKAGENITNIKNLSSFVMAAMEAARVYILPKGCIEHYYKQNQILYMPVSGKDRLFRNELEFIQTARKSTVRKRYCELIALLEKACSRN